MTIAPDQTAIRQRVFLVVVDGSPEMRVALRYAARRAQHLGGRVVLLHVFEPVGRQHWGAMESLLRDEGRQEAEQLMSKIAAETSVLTGQLPAIHLREGETREELFKLLDEDPSISTLILAARTAENGPGPLVSALSGKYIGRLRVPVTILPDTLTDAQIDAIS
jgi:nucleotide-binding universal stress UspA family protein